MAANLEPNERTAEAQQVGTQPDGPGRRVGVKGELSFILDLAPDGASIFRERLPQIQAEAAYWETRVGTVQELRALLIDNDTRMLLTITYDGDFQPYLVDIADHAAPWLDRIFTGVIDGFGGVDSPDAGEFFAKRALTAELYFVAHPDVSVRDVAKMKRLSDAFGEVLDAAS
jgi:hypothetical protein